MSDFESAGGKQGPKSRLEAHNKKYAAQYRIAPENIPDVALNPDWFVTKIESPWKKELVPGVTMTGNELELSDGDFTNIYDVCVAPDSPARVELLSFKQPKKPTHIFRDAPGLVAMSNAAFFYIVDDTDPIARQGPEDGTLNWCMRDGKIFGLPSTDRPALFEIDGHLYGKDIKAEGEMLIKGTCIHWVGGQHIMHAPKEEWATLYDPEKITVFNSGCTAIVKENDNPHALRILEKETYHTPQHPDTTALAVCLEDDGLMRVKKVQKGGKMGVFDGNFVLQMPTHLVDSLGIKEDDIVTPTTLGDIDLSKVHSAFTVGPSVLDYKNPKSARQIDQDRSFAQPPPFTESKRYARTIVFKDPKGIHLRVYDAVPMSSHFRGVSPVEIAQNLSEDVEWAFFCDGGQSSVIGTRGASGSVEFFGNKHYGYKKLEATEALLEKKPNPRGSVLLGLPRPLPSGVGIFSPDVAPDQE